MKLRISISLLALLLAASCVKSETEIHGQIAKLWEENFVKNYDETEALDIFVVTNRNQKSANFDCKEDAFGPKNGAALQFGVCKINVPKNHDTTETALSNNVQNSSANYYKILEAKSLAEADLIKQIKDSKRTPLIFVHGFNVKYHEAILRASQIAYDLKYQGPIILFTWPAGSKDGSFGVINKTYEDNAVTARESVATFRDLIARLQKNDIIPNIIVHSMGHQVMLPALNQLSLKNPQTQYVNELILNAPDFDAQSFANFANNLKETSKRTTLYCSYNDKAMSASEIMNKNDRLGACSFNQNIDVINVSLLKNANNGLGHSYYSSREILTDVTQLLLGIKAEKRIFIKKSEPNSTEKYFLRD